VAAFILQLIANGISMGAIYALVAVGLSLIYGVLEIVNFAHGEFLMLGGFVAFFAVGTLGLGYWPAVLIAAGAIAILGLLLFDTLLHTLKPDDFQKGILLTMGISMILQNGTLYLLKATPRSITTQYGYDAVEAGDVSLSVLRVIAILVALAAIAGLHAFLQYTRSGKSMRALAQNRFAAIMVGMRPRVVARTVFVIGCGLSGLAGGVLAPIYTVDPLMGTSYVFKAFAIIIIGGMGNIWGAISAAMIVGMTESLAGGLGSVVLQDALAFVIMIAMLLVRPMGLFGRGMRV
jgi:branched-chain amino acid transport system permease protein